MGDSLYSCDAKGEIEPNSCTAEQKNGRFFVQLEEKQQKKNSRRKF